ncbi:ATP-binding cassette domain-containing protein [Pikeienuella piscinae]|uniref:Trimethylamine N-oxide transport system ATP-binding protein TmoW n=1 Tax=Pikeienuella piscinae TaxID=2748098 RepID=A0A7M3T5W0_9RHOB|nr:ATP-binding cassette domain-containing protein [Pikeienuella piscinae]QIE57391.1 ATP-binding cassette domain-containing protein [Pikeienuella piscinae]
MTGDVQIKCRNIWKIFGDDPKGFLARHNGAPEDDAFGDEGYIGAVRDVSFDVRQGEILIIMGLSGSGKSTLIRCITRLNDPTAGEMEYEGRDLLKASEAELIDIRRHKMGMVFQNFGLLPHRDVLSNVAFPLEVQGVARAKRDARAREMIQLVGLEGREAYFPRQLSGGQQQRVGIARSLAVEPDIWFLDEPFSALDPLIRTEMQDEFIRLQQLLKKTIVFITHDFEEATKLADRIGIMKDGRMVQLATPEEIVLNPADEYVAEFARNAPHARIVSARTIMGPVSEGMAAATVPADAKIGAIAAQVIGSDAPTPVVDEAGAPIGAITRETVSDALFRAR